MTKSKTKPGPNKSKESPKKKTVAISPKLDKNEKQTQNSSSKTNVACNKKEVRSPVMTPKCNSDQATATPDTPSSAVRRSGRAPVLSSKFKDMEVDLFSVRKKSSLSIIETSKAESDSEPEPPKKRGRKPGSAAGYKILDDSDKVQKEGVMILQSNDNDQQEINKDVQVNDKVQKENYKILKDTNKYEQEADDVQLGNNKVQQDVISVLRDSNNVGQLIETVLQDNEDVQQDKEVVVQGIEDIEQETVTFLPDNDVLKEGDKKDDFSNEVICEEPAEKLSSSEVVLQTTEHVDTVLQDLEPQLEKEPESSTDVSTSVVIDDQQVNLVNGDDADCAGPSESRNNQPEEHTAKSDVVERILDPAVVSQILSSDSLPKQNVQILTINDPDKKTYVKLTVEPTSLAVMMKDGQGPTKSTKWHGRVVKNELSNVSSMAVKATSIQSPPMDEGKEIEKNEAPETFAVTTKNSDPQPSSQKSSHHGMIQATQMPSKIVIVRQIQKSSDGTSLTHSDNKSATVPTVVRVPQDLPSKKTSTTIVRVPKGTLLSNDELQTMVKTIAATKKGFIPKTASELLLRKLQEQKHSNRVIVHDSATTSDSLVKSGAVVAEPTSSGKSEEENMKKEYHDPDHGYSMGHITVVPFSEGLLKVMPDSEQEMSSAAEASETTVDLTELKNVEISLPSADPSSGKKNGDSLPDKIRIIDSGVEYDMRIISEEEVAEEVIDNVCQKEIKEEPVLDGDIIFKTEDEESNPLQVKHTSGTQTVYSPQVVVNQAGEPMHTLASVVDEDGQKKQVYYVSVIPNLGPVKKAKQIQLQNDTNWVLNDTGMYCCGKCNYKTDRKANFYKHRRLHTGSKPHVCMVCQYKAGTSSNLKRHMGIHRDIREHKCDICGLSFRQKIHLERHVKYKHEEKKVKCPMCDYVCANEQPDLKMHMKRKHSSGSTWEVVKCPQCSVEVSSRKDLKQHMKFHKDGPELKLFCKECSFVTDCQSRLKRHVAIHSKLKPFQCGACNYRAAQKEHVLRHLRTQHKIDIKKETKRPWRRHKNMETDDGSKDRADFSSGDKIFACNHCVMRFAKLINLYKHLHTQHADIMPAETEGNYFCVVCDFSTSSKKNLLVHMRRHNLIDQTPPTHVYSCVLCRYINPKRRNLFQHMRKKHNVNLIGQPEGDDEGSQDNDSGEALKMSTSEGEDGAEGTKSQTQMTGQPGSVIKIETLSKSFAETDDMHSLVIDTREIIHTTHTVEALEGLQALSEQARIDNIIEEQVPSMDEQHIVVTSGEVVGDGQHYHQNYEVGEVEMAGCQATGGLELTEEQLSNLQMGDMVEMDGELYVVELTQDDANPGKQVLSLVPVNTGS